MVDSLATTALTFAKSWNSLLDQIPPLPSLIRESEVLYVLGGSFKSFTDRAENLEAVKSLLESDTQVRFLMMHPDSELNTFRAQDRQARGVSTSPERLTSEVLVSLSRFVDHLGVEATKRVMRLYGSIPHNAIYRLGNRYLLNVYTFGRGGSSPAQLLVRNSQTSDFCAALDASFDERWAASSTHVVSDEVLQRASRV